jgi:hypothetical protein
MPGKDGLSQLPGYQRVSHPPSMRLTERDRLNSEAIHAYDGMLDYSQIRENER